MGTESQVSDPEGITGINALLDLGGKGVRHTFYGLGLNPTGITDFLHPIAESSGVDFSLYRRLRASLTLFKVFVSKKFITKTRIVREAVDQ